MEKFFVDVAKKQRHCDCGCNSLITKGEKIIAFSVGKGTSYQVSGNLKFRCAFDMQETIAYYKIKSVKVLKDLLSDGLPKDFALFLEGDIVSTKSLLFLTNKKTLTVHKKDDMLAPWKIFNWSDSTEEVLTDEEFAVSNIVKWIKAGQFYLAA